MSHLRCILPNIVLIVLSVVTATISCAAAVDYAKDVKPVLKAHCYPCHGALKQKASLRLDTVAAMRLGGDDGDATKLIVGRVTTPDKKEHMPPEGDGSSLNADEIEKLKAWLSAGAPAFADEQPEPDPRAHWAYQVPKSSGKTMDALMAAHLASKNLKPQPEAAPEIWLRRVYIDLIGLPPSPEDIMEFVRDSSTMARARLVDRLLASPQYGERWARHFMDIWRYCDWYGLGAQLRHSQKHIWHWRDWIVESLNRDKGYDRMILEQLAADELAPEDRANLRATGFLARGYYLFNRSTWLDETIEHTSRAFLGLTMQCVKCHSHKYDPIEHSDYYRMRAIFEPVHVRLDPWPGETDLEKNALARVYDLHLERATWRHVRGDDQNEDKSKPMLPGVPEVLSFAPFEPQVVKLPRTASQPALLPFVLDDQLRAAEKQTGAVGEKRTIMIRAVFAAENAKQDKTLARAASVAQTNYELALAEADIAVLEKEAGPTDAKKKEAHEKKLKAAHHAVAAAKKKAEAPGETYSALRTTLKAQEGPDDPNNAAVQTYPETSSGRRLAFAQWIADKRNPLTARVLVNHLWTRHFGVSLVPNGDDFGRRCPAPAQQDVLDTLAVEFINHGWSLKHLHRAMLLSELYCRSSSNAGADAQTMAADPDNTFYWRMNPRRMESQAVRDSLLQLAGKLDPTPGGPSLDPLSSETSSRRSLYFIQNADVEHRFLATFDNANVLECYRRNESVVPQQALALTNSRLTHECAEALAARMELLAEEEFIVQSFMAVLGRAPTEEERRVSSEGFHALNRNRRLFLLALLSHNDFITLR